MNPGRSHLKTLAKKLTTSMGWSISRRDRLLDLIPSSYLQSPFLPRLHRRSLGRTLYFTRMFERASQVPGDIVECGVSIGHGLLLWALLSELAGDGRRIWGFDSFAGFPDPTRSDERTDGSAAIRRGDYQSAPELVLKVLADGQVSQETIRDRVRLVRGFFGDSLQAYDGSIAILHLDCDLYESYHTCLSALYERVATGGLILFDEYEDRNYPGCRQAVDEFFADKVEKPAPYVGYQYRRHFVVKS